MAGPRPKATVDYGFDPTEAPYHFAVIVPKDELAVVTVEERFNWGDDPEVEKPRAPQVKAVLERFRWLRIAEPLRREFNVRLRASGLSSGQWRTGETLLVPYLGKELTLLFWAVEDDDSTLIPNMIANWQGLAPEERWWLYTTINATSMHAEHGRDRGWRKAIKIAFAENPALTEAATFLNPYDRPLSLPIPEPRDDDAHFLLFPDQSVLSGISRSVGPFRHILPNGAYR